MATEKEFELIEKRFETFNERMKLCIIGMGNFTKKDILEHIKAQDSLGQKLAEVQLYYLKKLKEGI